MGVPVSPFRFLTHAGVLRPSRSSHWPSRLENASLILREPRLTDYEAWRTARETSHAALTRWEPDWQPEELSRQYFARTLKFKRRARLRAQRLGFFAFNKDSQTLIGAVTLSNISFGNQFSGEVGYWVTSHASGKGYASQMVGMVSELGIETLGLQRLQAACQPENLASRRVLEKNDFKYEGLARQWLFINGAWRDHEIWARCESGFVP